MQKGQYDEAFWLVFLLPRFTKHPEGWMASCARHLWKLGRRAVDMGQGERKITSFPKRGLPQNWKHPQT